MTIYDPDLGYKLWVWVTFFIVVGAVAVLILELFL